MNERERWKQKPLLERLRSFEYMALDHICCEAADRIAELEAQLSAVPDLVEALETIMNYPDIRGYIGSLVANQCDSALAKYKGE